MKAVLEYIERFRILDLRFTNLSEGEVAFGIGGCYGFGFFDGDEAVVFFGEELIGWRDYALLCLLVAVCFYGCGGDDDSALRSGDGEGCALTLVESELAGEDGGDGGGFDAVYLHDAGGYGFA